MRTHSVPCSCVSECGEVKEGGDSAYEMKEGRNEEKEENLGGGRGYLASRRIF